MRVRVAVDPMNGRAAPGDRLLLYRTVVAEQQGYRQGLLIDWRALGDWLRGQVIEPSGVGRAGGRALFFGTRDGPEAPADDSPYVFRHPFAEPFDAFGVELRLRRLPGGRGTGTIHALAALLVVVTAAGLLAVRRMVRVVLGFAERRSRFAASVSHELKTPLTSIRMYGEMLRDGLVPDDSKRAEYYATITDESERLSRLIDNVLDFSRLERGEYRTNAAPGALQPVLEEAVAKLSPHAARQGFRISLEVEPDLPEVRFDRDALTQIVFNLVDNALKYARDAERREIEIRCARDRDEVRLSVRDFGPGVPEPERTRIFEPFHRVGDADVGASRAGDEQVRSARGTGIGLALVRELAEAMGGRAGADAAPGGGLCVSLQLPAADPAASDTRA
jgi:signal transduction histidine kinase